MAYKSKYKTIKNPAEFELVEKKSKFIAAAAPAESIEEAQVFIDNLKKKHYNASHNCFAYKIGLENETVRCSDDGEPSGTAGIPILNVLNGEDLKNTVVVVTRYFGGTLLGTGGLIRAYGASAKQSLINAQIIEKNLYSVIRVIIEYGLSGKLQYETLNQGHYIYDTVYTDNVEYTILVEVPSTPAFLEIIKDISNATAFVNIERTVYGTKYDGIIEI